MEPIALLQELQSSMSFYKCPVHHEIIELIQTGDEIKMHACCKEFENDRKLFLDSIVKIAKGKYLKKNIPVSSFCTFKLPDMVENRSSNCGSQCTEENEDIGIDGMLSDVINIIAANKQDIDIHLLHLHDDDAA